LLFIQLFKLYYTLQVSSAERLKLLQEPPKTPSVDNIWKWADGFVNKDYLTTILSSIDPYNPRVLKPSSVGFSNLSAMHLQ